MKHPVNWCPAMQEGSPTLRCLNLSIFTSTIGNATSGNWIRTPSEGHRPQSIMPFTVEKASLSDAKAIADIYQDRPVTAWNRLTHGTVDPSVFNAGLEDMFAESLRDPDEVLFLARDEDHPDRRVVSYVNLAKKAALVPMTDEVRRLHTCE